jgi:uncharacterized membrane protein
VTTLLPHLAAAGTSLKVPWGQTPMYNTVMSVAAGVGLLLFVWLGYLLYTRRPVLAEGWAAAFGVLGLILTITGAHMSLTWPLSNIAPFDNVIFGEPSLAFGVIMLAAAVIMWTQRARLATEVGEAAQGNMRLDYARQLSAPLSLFAAAMGLGLFGIAAAGWRYTLFAAPPQEPISGQFANHPLLEATFISGLYLLAGLGLVLLPIAVQWLHRTVVLVIGVAWTVAGLAFPLFGALNFFTHIGLIIHTT